MEGYETVTVQLLHTVTGHGTLIAMTTLDPQRLKEAGALIRRHRGNRTQRAVAAQLGMSLQRYQALETGRSGESPAGATVATYEAVALAVGIDPDDLFTVLGVETPGSNEGTSMTPTLGEMLRKRRTVDLNGTSLRDLAYGSGLSHTTLAWYERDRSLPKDESIPLVARAYRLPVAELRQMVATARASQTDLRLPDKYKELSPKAWRALLTHADLLLSLQGHPDDTDTRSE